MLAVSDAINPSGSPLPKFSLFFEALFASPYETMLAMLPPAPGRIPIKVPINAPLIASNLPTMINTGLNKTGTGGTVPIFGVDGSPVIHDVYMILHEI